MIVNNTDRFQCCHSGCGSIGTDSRTARYGGVSVGSFDGNPAIFVFEGNCKSKDGFSVVFSTHELMDMARAKLAEVKA